MATLVTFLVLLVCCVALPQVTADNGDDGDDDDGDVAGCPLTWTVLGRVCLRVERVMTADRKWGAPITWHQARHECQNMVPGVSDLAVIHDRKLLATIYGHVSHIYPEETHYGWTYWVGGHKVGRTWMWTTGELLPIKKNMWLPKQPRDNDRFASTHLVPIQGRFWLGQQYEGRANPGYVCQLFGQHLQPVDND